MVQHLVDLLDAWLPTYQEDWVLAVLTQVQGSSYRKPGAIMLFHPMGKSLGMLSGGCLEADLRRHAQRAIQTQQILQLTYDATDESDTSYQLGCGGIVNIMMVLLNKTNNYLGLLKVHDALMRGDSGVYQLSLADDGAPSHAITGQYIEQHSWPSAKINLNRKTEKVIQQHNTVLNIPLRPPVHIGIFGGGLDAQPLAQMAQTMGWKVTVFDERTAYARTYDFPGCQIIKHPITNISQDILTSLDAAFVMNHNLQLDAKTLNALKPLALAYIALLGPAHRRDKVFGIATLSLADFSGYFAAPAGLALGGELPGSVALSMLSQCHGVLYQAKLTRLDSVMV
ncbi:XdhC family protein [Shewanella inventionis]|uniref:Xanthine and CO dehydrogenase family maturation factor XdhC/CoxF family protein n=1 Tax=Shewanella inventionis TaxID=1738770 RepID=A0ABQ1IRJ1_9GAMM|nr:XdhC/CoxI family protein [Shewanella inventionis]MCL1156910.1 XdhC family protein [Shewanella inventionis]UAL45159.1 XdhC family protein [Shewanella inventionis]GGB50800.1 xanthine and CO dehydrogenase family maturation factor XdhC/CoxF family protein [Shewanella inventionis]